MSTSQLAERKPSRAEVLDEVLATEDYKFLKALKNSEIDVIVNLTVPAAHYGVSMDIISAGKHSYSEKPFVLSVQDGAKPLYGLRDGNIDRRDGCV